MARFLLAMFAAALVALTFVPGAHAGFTLGIDTQNTVMLDDPRFHALGVKQMRVVVPYDVTGNPEALARYTPVFEQARHHNIRVLVAFNHSITRAKHLPSVAEYTRHLQAFRARFPWVSEITVWNEANHSTQPTYRNPRMAAQYFNAARRACKGCTIVAADVLDSSNLMRWVTTFRRHAKSPKIWGLHNYKDVHRLRDTSIQVLRKATAGRGQVWLTETGGIVRFADSIPYDERRAANATAYVLKLAAKRRVSRVYLYKWTGEQLGHRWDSGLIAVDGRPRPALNVVEKHLGRPLTPLPPLPKVPKFPTAPALL